MKNATVANIHAINTMNAPTNMIVNVAPISSSNPAVLNNSSPDLVANKLKDFLKNNATIMRNASKIARIISKDVKKLMIAMLDVTVRVLLKIFACGRMKMEPKIIIVMMITTIMPIIPVMTA